MSTFTSTFDRTFKASFLPQVTPTAPDTCRLTGVYLTWLTLERGWCYWLFEGKVTREKPVGSRGQVVRAGLTRYNKESTEAITIRTTNLTEREADIVGTVYESSAVYLFQLVAGKFKPVLVTIEPGTFAIWQSRQARGTLDVRFSVPPKRMQLI